MTHDPTTARALIALACLWAVPGVALVLVVAGLIWLATTCP